MTALNWLGWSACALSLTGCAMRDDRHLKVAMLLSFCLWIPYYALLGGLTGCLAIAVTGVRQVLVLLAHRFSPKVLRWVTLGLMAALSAATLWSWAGWSSALPLLAGLNSTYAYMRLKGPPLRLRLAAGDSVWGVYAVVLAAWPHLAFTLAAVSLNLWTAYRVHRAVVATPAIRPTSVLRPDTVPQ